MLVLTRKVGEQIKIGDEVIITVVRTKGKAVRLGVQAPSHVPVLRGEIAAAIAGEEEQKQAGDQRDEESWAESSPDARAMKPASYRISTPLRSAHTAVAPLRHLLAARSV